VSKYHKHFINDDEINCVDYRKNYKKSRRIGGFAVYFSERDDKIVAKCKLLPKEITANTLHSCLLKVANALKRVKRKELEEKLIERRSK